MTRMDLHVDPAEMCPKHLLGNHNETHQLDGYLQSADADTGALNKLLGHAARGQIDIIRLDDWHDELETEMRRRGWDADSPLSISVDVPIGEGQVTESATNKLSQRCGDCGGVPA